MKKLTKQNLEELAQQMAVIDTATQAKFIGGGDGTWGNPWTAEEYYNSDINGIIGGWVVIDGITDYMCPGGRSVAGITNSIAETAVQFLGINEREHADIINRFWRAMGDALNTGGYDGYTGNTKWCAAFVSFALVENGYSIPSTYPEGVANWADYGLSVDEGSVMAGDVAIFAGETTSHIGIIGAVNGDKVYVIHGNTSIGQGDNHGVKSEWKSKSAFKNFRRPQ